MSIPIPPMKQILTSYNFMHGRTYNGITYIPRYIILHTEDEGTKQTQEEVAQEFGTPGFGASANNLIGMDGGIIRVVNFSDTAYHAANFCVNIQSIGIEHEDNHNPNDSIRTDALYASSAWLVAFLCDHYNIPCKLVDAITYVVMGSDGKVVKFIYPVEPGILKHSQVSVPGTACPDGLDCNRIVRQANKILSDGIITSTGAIK